MYLVIKWKILKQQSLKYFSSKHVSSVNYYFYIINFQIASLLIFLVIVFGSCHIVRVFNNLYEVGPFISLSDFFIICIFSKLSYRFCATNVQMSTSYRRISSKYLFNMASNAMYYTYLYFFLFFSPSRLPIFMLRSWFKATFFIAVDWFFSLNKVVLVAFYGTQEQTWPPW